MIVSCPACGARHSLDALLAANCASEAMRALSGITPLGRKMVAYLALFRPEKRSLTWERVNTLVEQIAPAIVTGRAEHAGRSYAAPEDVWCAAIDAVVAARDAGTLRTPLKSHGYLLSIIAAAADKAEARSEAHAEENKRRESAFRVTPGATSLLSAQESGKGVMPDAVKAQLAKFATRGTPKETDDSEKS